MYYSTIREIDTANCIGVGVSIFVSGCRNHCKGCFQPETWDFKYGNEFNDDKLKEILDFVNRDYIDSFSILGGDPFEPENINEVANIIKNVREEKPNIKIYLWTGYNYDDLRNNKFINESILNLSDYIIDGKFDTDKKDLSLKLRGSSNQRIIDLKTGVDITSEMERL